MDHQPEREQQLPEQTGRGPARAGPAAEDDKIDIFLIEADYALKYVDSPYTLDVRADIGLTDDELAGQYKYTQDIASADGVLKGITWQATPVCLPIAVPSPRMCWARTIPPKCRPTLSDWDKFNDVAEKAAAKGLQDALRLDDELPHLLQQRIRRLGRMARPSRLTPTS